MGLSEGRRVNFVDQSLHLDLCLIYRCVRVNLSILSSNVIWMHLVLALWKWLLLQPEWRMNFVGLLRGSDLLVETPNPGLSQFWESFRDLIQNQLESSKLRLE